MKKILTLSLILLAFSWPASADTIIFRDGMRVEVSEAWEKNGEVKCKIGDDDFERADEGAGGWVGMITNDAKTGKLSDNPKLSLK